MRANAHIGRIFRRFGIGLGKNSRVDWSSGAPEGRVRTASRVLCACLIAPVTVLALFALCTPTAFAAEPPPTLWQGCEGQLVSAQDVGGCKYPEGIAVSQVTGDVYFSDGENSRINEFTAWGEFVRAFGWDVNASAPEEKLQTCNQATGCKQAGEGSHVGEFHGAAGVAIDAVGDVYVVDNANFRVQKFDPEGHFLLMFGGGVDKGPHHPGNLCTAAYIAEGDDCGAGETGAAEGQFAWAYGSNIAVGPDGAVYVGDKERIQEFNSDGEYTGEVKGGALAGETVTSLAIDPTSGDMYVTFIPPPFNGQFTSAGPVLKLSDTGTTLCTLTTSRDDQSNGPTGLATDADGNLYVADESSFSTVDILKFDSTCKPVVFEPTGPGFGSDTIGSSIGLATSSACGISGSDLYVANRALSKANIFGTGKANEANFVRAYGPPPNPTLCPQPAVAPEIASQYAATVGTSYATLDAQINPRFWPDATYYLEYGTGKCSEGGCTQRSLYPGASLTTKILDSPLTTTPVFLQGLSLNTTYHFRFVAQSGGGGPVYGTAPEGASANVAMGVEGSFTTSVPSLASNAHCLNQEMRVGPSSVLPDCRAYEMVSPVDKQGADVVVSFSADTSKPARLDQAASNGEGITYSSYRAFSEPKAAPFTSQYMAVRHAGQGWSNEDISPPEEGQDELELGGDHDINYKAFSENLCDAWILKGTEPLLAPEAINGYANLYHRDDCGAGGYETLSKGTPTGVNHGINNNPFVPAIEGFSADGTRAFFSARGKLTPDANIRSQLYESYGGKLRLVCYLPNGAPFTGECTAGTGSDTTYNYDDSLDHAVSADGSRVYFSAAGKLYVRLHPDQQQSITSSGKCTEPAKACTLAVSSGLATFWGAAADGSSVIYTEGGTPGAGLYEASLGEEASKAVIHSHLMAGGSGGVMGTSEDGSLVYFASTEVLTEEENEAHAKAQSGKQNLYLYHSGGAGALAFTFITMLSANDFERGSETVSTRPIETSPYFRSARVSPDGLHAAFMSSGSLTGYDNTDQSGGVADAEVFLYDAASDDGTGRLRCISCLTTGARPSGRNVNEAVAAPDWIAAQIPGWEYDMHASRALSDNGERVFFNSFEALVPEDTDGAEDVYEWERGESQAQCEADGAELYLAREGGCLSLISSGESPADSTFVDASADGSDVFFTTGSSLAPPDSGGQVDIYDARVDGGLPPPPSPAPVCEGEACQNPPAPPLDLTPGSLVFSGTGNLQTPTASATKAKTKPKSTKCKKGYVKKKGKCVKKPKKKPAKRNARKSAKGRK